MIIGIDPGYSGGIAFLDEDTRRIVKISPIPVDKEGEVNFSGMVALLGHAGGKDTIVIEDVHSVFGASAKANFQFGRICGILRACAEFTGAHVTTIQPKAWQKKVWEVSDYVTKGKGKDTKATSLNAIKRLYPDMDFRKSDRAKKAHDGIVDAVLIAYSQLI